MRTFCSLLIILLTTHIVGAQSRTGYLTKDGAWCWFSDPRAIILDAHVISGWVKSDGTIEAARLSPVQVV